jgi:hypothetical protein
MREVLLDLIRHTGGLGFLDTVKITGSKSETKVEAMDNDRTVILKAKFKTPEPKFTGEFGMSRFNILQGFLGFASYKADGAKFDIHYKEREGVQTPQELVFRDQEGQSSTYRFMDADLIPEQARFIGVNWDVSVAPSRSKLQEFIQMAGILSSVEHYFLVKTVDDSLKFYIGDEDASTDKACITIEKDIEGSLKGDLYWDVQSISPIMKLGLDENISLDFSNKGALRLSMQSPFIEYEYLFPARKK